MDVFGEAGLSGHLGVNIGEGGTTDGKLGIGETPTLEIIVNAAAEADIFAKVATTAGAIPPSVSTFIQYDQTLGEATWSSATGFKFTTSSPSVKLQDVTLDAGSIMGSFFTDSLSIIKDILEPIRPVIDLLTFEVDLGIAQLQLIDMAYLRLPAKTVDTAKKVIQAIKSTLEFIDSLDTVGGNNNFGDFDLGGAFLSDPESEVTDDEIGGSSRPAPTGGSASIDKVVNGPNQKGLDKGKQKNFRLPILEDPATMLGLLTGKTVDLFWYDLPDLELEFRYSKTFPVFPGLNVGIVGSVGASTNFDFGFDTSGFIEFQESGYDLTQIWRIMKGFYLDDHGLENTASDLNEITLTALLGATASLGLGGLIEAGVTGGIEATIGFDLNDKLTEFEDGNPVGDGKLYGHELIERISHGPECLFDVNGQLKVFLEAFLWVGLDFGFGRITLFEARERFIDEIIAEFNWECMLSAPEDIADLSGDGKTIDLRYSGSDSDGQHRYTVTALGEDEKVNSKWTLETLFKKGLSISLTIRPLNLTIWPLVWIPVD